MQYETVFDIDYAIPRNWTGLWVGVAIITLFVIAHVRPQRLEAPTLPDQITDQLPRRFFPAFIWHWMQPMVTLLVMSVLALAVVLAPRWRWGVAVGCLIMAQTLWHLGSSFNAIEHLRNASNIEIVSGSLSKINDYVTNSGRREYLDVASRHFDYSEHDPGTPYSLESGSSPIAAGQHVRLSVVDNHIIRVERQLCLVYVRCSVRYFLTIRFETEIP